MATGKISNNIVRKYNFDVGGTEVSTHYLTKYYNQFYLTRNSDILPGAKIISVGWHGAWEPEIDIVITDNGFSLVASEIQTVRTGISVDVFYIY